MKKRIISWLLGSALLVSMLAACGQQGGTSSVTSESGAGSQADNTASTDEITEIEFFSSRVKKLFRPAIRRLSKISKKSIPI